MDQTIQDSAQTTESTASVPQLTLSDLTLALQTIQVTVQRGAIRADEMTTVGQLYDRLYAFLNAQGALTPPADNSTTPQGE
jgi:hypothetical protein